jgi:hypothetical protein
VCPTELHGRTDIVEKLSVRTVVVAAHDTQRRTTACAGC